MSEQFSVNIGLRQGSALSPLLFIVVMELISRKVSMKDTSRKLLYADDLAIVAEDNEELNESPEEWKEAFETAWTEGELGEDRGVVDRCP